MDELIAEFLTETSESLGSLDNDLVKLEQNPNDKSLLSNIFRLMHTIKGTCGFLGLPRLETVAHRAENVLGRFRDGDLLVTPAYVSLILQSIDRVRMILDSIEKSGKEPEGSDSDLIEKLDAVYEGRDTQIISTEQAPVIETPPEKTRLQNIQHDTTGESGTVANQTLRVNVDVLEKLMTMVSELVLTRNQLLQILRGQKESNFSTPLQRLNHVVSDLQDGVMKTRMQPVGNAWTKLPRIIRDISLELGKKIDLEMHGENTELDRQVLDMIKDPLTHMVRNSADHDIEMPQDRIKVGKPETGRIILSAFHEGGHIIIQISDDGKGLPLEKIKNKALQNGLVTQEELATLSPQQIQQFIFKAGFSTAEKVTSVSGRGVGMDVVRTNIEKIGGAIEMNSIEGKGSTFTIKIPLTLAIVSSLIVEVCNERYALPQLAVRELVLTNQTSQTQIETIKGAPFFRLRNKLLPLVSLEHLLKLSDITNDLITALTGQKKYIIVTQVGGYQFGIIVDRVYDTEEIVVKPVARILKHLEIFSGNTILGDGSVIMILDPLGIAKATGKLDVSSKEEDTSGATDTHNKAEKTSLLLFRAGEGAPKAVPLALISRLENIKTSHIEHASGKMMIQYRDQLMPLMPFDHTINMNLAQKPVLVFTDRTSSMGIVVDEIIDITEEHINVQVSGNQAGIIGSTIIDDKATDIVDVAHFLYAMNKDWFKNHSDEAFIQTGSLSSKRRLLLVDDSPFFRNMLTPLLSIAGYDITTVEGPKEALSLCEAGYLYDLIISDIEMPDMDGFEFASRIRAGGPWAHLPMIALSSHATTQDIDHGQKVGFTKYVAKFDRDTLLNTLSETLSLHTGSAS